MSVSTPILTMLSETCADAAPGGSAAAKNVAAKPAATGSPNLVGFTLVLP
jgi:hypothetical protein